MIAIATNSFLAVQQSERDASSQIENEVARIVARHVLRFAGANVLRSVRRFNERYR